MSLVEVIYLVVELYGLRHVISYLDLHSARQVIGAKLVILFDNFLDV